ncbi:cytochrome c [Pedobacter frigiditerrae]|uniref:c-type cytochrome n=1 Tax=Pedobacter frigiditerrae TaxID=2530452 RepID=UPI00292F4F4D|nr:cytochrome c [Pedobacter frigiditerrae]
MRKNILLSIFSIVICCIIYSCQNAAEMEQTQYISGGKDLYIKYCQNCHSANGEGLGELYPALTDTVFLKENKEQLACIIKNGSNKPVVINGKKYDGKMPSFKQIENIDLAKIIVYITNSFGNKQGMYKFEQVAKDLEKCK